MAIEKTITVKLDTAQAVTDLKKVRGEIDITYAELRRTTPIELDGSKAKTVLKDVSNEIKSTAKETKGLGKEGSKSFGELGEAVKKLLPSLPGIEDLGLGVKMIGTAADTSSGFFDKLKISTKGFGLALKATGIGLIVGALVKMQEALSKNQVVMDKVNVIMETINITLQKFVNNIVKAFTNPQETIKKFGDTIKTYVVDYVQGAIDSVGLFGEAIGKVFKGEFKEAADLAKKGAKTIWDTNPIVKMNKAVVDYNKSIGETVTENNKSAQALVKLRKEVKLAEADQRLLQLQYQKEAEVQRQIRDNVSLTMDERIAANEKLGQILEEQFAEEQALAEKKLELAELELSKNEENIDLQIAVTNAKTEMADLDERITGQRSEQLINLISLEKEQAEAIKATAEAEKQAAADVAKYQKERDVKKQGSADAFQELLDRNLTNAQVAEKKIREEFKKMNDVIVQGIVTGAITAEQAVTQTSLLGQEKRQALSDSAQAHTQADIDFLMMTMGKSKAFIEKHTAEELELIAHKNRVDLAEAQKTAQMKDAKLQAGLSAAKGVTDALGGLAKEGSKGAKAMALTGILIDTAKGISGAISAGAGVPFPGNLVAIATGVTSVLAGIANAKKVFAKAGGSGGGSESVNVSSGASVAGSRANIPNIENINDSQLGQETPTAPVQAYVVENDISDSQALQEELETQATL